MKTVALSGLLAALSLIPMAYQSAHAEDAGIQQGNFKQVRFSLIHAQNKGIEETMPIPAKLRKSLDLLFGYSKYRVLGEARSDLSSGKEVPFQPNSLFYIKLSRVTDQPNCYSFELMQEDASLVKGKYSPKKEVPLIIRGPFYDKGNLILVIQSEFSE
jgi:hypothetical protein